MKKKPYVSPTIISVKLDSSQAVLSNCFVDIMNIRNAFAAGDCEGGAHPCKQSHGGTSAATS